MYHFKFFRTSLQRVMLGIYIVRCDLNLRSLTFTGRLFESVSSTTSIISIYIVN